MTGKPSRRERVRSAMVTIPYLPRPAAGERWPRRRRTANLVPVPHPSTDTPPPEPGRPGASDTPGAPDATGRPGPAAPGSDGIRADEPLVTGAESAWSAARFVRLGAARPGPAARRARWFGVPLVPLLTAALVAGAFLSVRGGPDGVGLADGHPGGDPIGAPSAVDERGAAPAEPTRTADGATADTPGAATPTHTAGTDGPPTRPAPEDRARTPRAGTSPTPLRSGKTAPGPVATPSTGATPTGRPSGDRRPGHAVSFEALRVGECFDIDRDAPGTALRRRCDTPHHAELIARPRLVGTFATDQAVREAATLLCREPLRRKAARQPLGTRWKTFVQYPYRTSHLLGADTVACSLAATSGRLTGRLQ